MALGDGGAFPDRFPEVEFAIDGKEIGKLEERRGNDPWNHAEEGAEEQNQAGDEADQDRGGELIEAVGEIVERCALPVELAKGGPLKPERDGPLDDYGEGAAGADEDEAEECEGPEVRGDGIPAVGNPGGSAARHRGRNDSDRG